jgi:hypothetical protein
MSMSSPRSPAIRHGARIALRSDVAESEVAIAMNPSVDDVEAVEAELAEAAERQVGDVKFAKVETGETSVKRSSP